jgi:3',5'-cyclic-nucleotide phosphodiesterase
MMDHAACCVIYVDQGIAVDRVISEDDGEILSGAAENGPVGVSGESNEIVENIKILSSIYHNGLYPSGCCCSGVEANLRIVYVCSSGPVCISKISAIGERIGADLTPTLVLVDIPQEEHKHGMTSPSQSSSASSLRHDSGVAPDPAEKSLHGTRLIQWISAEIQYQNISKLIVPVALIGRKAEGILANTGKAVLSAFGITPASSESAESFKESPSLETAEIVRYLDAGAVDVARSPLSKGCVAGLAVHAYRAHKEVLRDHEAFLAVKRGRKRSWVGVDEEKPYAYLREAM